MRRYPMVFIFLLSFVMPLQAVADILLSGLTCPMMLAAQAQVSPAVQRSTAVQNMQNTNHKMHNMKHCQPAAQVSTTQSTSTSQLNLQQDQTNTLDHSNCKDCPKIKCCHLCKTSAQAFVFLTSSFFSPRILAQVPEQPLVFFASFNPNAVWRPPIHA